MPINSTDTTLSVAFMYRNPDMKGGTMLQHKLTRRKTGTFLFLTAVAALHSHSQNAIAGNNAMKNNAIEITTFKLVAGANEDAFIKSNDAVNVFLKSQPGFVARRLSKAADGSYTDHVEWMSLANAETAMKASMQEASIVEFMQMIDPTSLSIVHNTLIVSL